MTKLRDYQINAIEDVKTSFRNGAKAPLLTAPTGSGKTVILSEICRGAYQKNHRVLLLVHRQELVIQTSKALARIQLPHNICASSNVVNNAVKIQFNEFGKSYYNFDSGIVIASIQTFVRRMADFLLPFDFILIDEAHHGVAGMWRTVIDAFPNAKILGVTATPERLDGRGLGVHCGGVYDDLVIGPTVQELIDLGFLTKPRVYAPPMQLELNDLKTIGGDFDRREMSKRLNKPKIIGDVIGHYRRLCDGVPAIAFCPTVEYAQYVAENFNAAGYRAACIDGKMDDFQRNLVINKLGSGKLDVLTSCEIVSEGTDIPVVGAAILLRKTKSTALYLQQVGRALRPYPGKSETIILDHVGNCELHGLPEEDRDWTLDGRKKKNRASDKSGPAIRQCMSCYSIYPATQTICPICGAVAQKTRAEIEQIEGELIEYTKRSARIDQARAKTLEELIAVGRSKGYQYPEAWAKKIMKAREEKDNKKSSLPLLEGMGR